jgi:hypothetical protein
MISAAKMFLQSPLFVCSRSLQAEVCFCFAAFGSQLFLMHDFCCKNVSAKPPLCLLSFTAGRSLLFLQAKASPAGSNLPSLQDKPLSLTFSASLRFLQAHASLLKNVSAKLLALSCLIAERIARTIQARQTR